MQTVSAYQFLQNIEEIVEDDEGVEVASQTAVLEKVRLEEQTGSGAIVELHASERDEKHAVEGDVLGTPTVSGNLPSLPIDK